MYFHKFILVLILLLVCSLSVNAQDTLAYEVQRQRVNDLLNKRTARFGQFNQSLEARTGIFGFKTKKDMQASIDILKEIIATDNHIFKETKVLLDYKDMEKTFISYKAEESMARINGYVNTISKQQKLQEQQSLEIQELQTKANRLLVYSLLSSLLIILLIIILFKQISKKKATPSVNS